MNPTLFQCAESGERTSKSAKDNGRVRLTELQPHYRSGKSKKLQM
jgi:hypothetical protein